MIGDLHCHSRFSDGSMGIDDLVFYAKRAGLDFVAVTDHDTLEGVMRATVLGKRHGITIISGVEISCFDFQRGRIVHLLCYMPDAPDRLQGMLLANMESHKQAGKRMMRAVTRFYPVTEEHISRYSLGSGVVYTSHIMQALIDLGYDNRTQGELYDRLFGRNGLCIYRPEFPDIYDVIKIVREAGGIAVLAHPPQCDSMELMRELVNKELLDGIEAFHISVSKEAEMEIKALANEAKLLLTGGSDFHGYFSDYARPIATRITPEENLQALFAFKKRR